VYIGVGLGVLGGGLSFGDDPGSNISYTLGTGISISDGLLGNVFWMRGGGATGTSPLIGNIASETGLEVMGPLYLRTGVGGGLITSNGNITLTPPSPYGTFTSSSFTASAFFGDGAGLTNLPIPALPDPLTPLYGMISSGTILLYDGAGTLDAQFAQSGMYFPSLNPLAAPVGLFRAGNGVAMTDGYTRLTFNTIGNSLSLFGTLSVSGGVVAFPNLGISVGNFGMKMNGPGGNEVFRLSRGTPEAFNIARASMTIGSNFPLVVLSSLTVTNYIQTGSSVNASAFFGDGSGLTNLPAPTIPNTFTSSITVNAPFLVGVSTLVVENAKVGIGAAPSGTENLQVAGSVYVSGAVEIVGDSTFQGVKYRGAKTAVYLRTFGCGTYPTTPCMAYNTNDDDLYTSTGSVACQWRNTRTGEGP
jgi:hypothetical protein